MFEQNMTMELGMNLLNLNYTIEFLEEENTRLALRAAKYKAYFFHKDDLVEKLETQMRKNTFRNPSGFNSEYRDLGDMLTDGLLTMEEYQFCVL